MPRPQSSKDTSAVLDTLEPDTLDLYHHWVLNGNIDLAIVSRIPEPTEAKFPVWWYQPRHEARELIKLYIANLKIEDSLILRNLILDKLMILSEEFQRRGPSLFDVDLVLLVWNNTPKYAELREFTARCCVAGAYERMAHDEELPEEFIRELVGWCLTMRGRSSDFDLPRKGGYSSQYFDQPEEAVDFTLEDWDSDGEAMEA
ncbi:hypothetical protein LTR17_023751 [Elasticomyces elasticus]|nr:hypothetical protein LTR17_023751 [Elasticomyces elasticus]